MGPGSYAIVGIMMVHRSPQGAAWQAQLCRCHHAPARWLGQRVWFERERCLDGGGDQGRAEEGLDFLEHTVLKGRQSSLDLVIHVLGNLSLHGAHRHL